jgi:DNA-binding IclR family transcriptional regulator
MIMARNESGPGSASTGRTLQVLETLVVTTAPVTLTELARRCGIPLATCSAIVASLEDRGYAQRSVVGRSHLWKPTLKLYGLGMQTLRRFELADESIPILNQLRDEVELTAHLGVLDGAQVVYVAKAGTGTMVQFNTYPGRVSPYNVTALGKAIAAFSPEHQQQELVDQAVPGRGPKGTGASGRLLREEFGLIRERGFAVEDQEEEAGIACIAAPVLDRDGFAVAAVGVTGLDHQLTPALRPEIARAVVQAADTVALRTGLRGS